MDVLRITSPQNPRIKAAARLRDHRARRQQGQFLIDGWREVGMAARAGIPLDTVFYSEALDDVQRGKLQSFRSHGASLIEVTSSVFQKIAFGDRNEGIVAIASALQRTLPQFTTVSAPLVLVLDQLEKPGNIGAIVRTASAAGVDAVVAIGPGADFYNPNAIRASLGAVFSVPCCVAAIAETRQWLKEHGLQIYAARVEAEKTLYEQDFTRGTALVLGSEAEGLSDKWSGDEVISVRIPMHGQVDSLNVSVSAAVLLYEAVRQRMSLVQSRHYPTPAK